MSIEPLDIRQSIFFDFILMWETKMLIISYISKRHLFHHKLSSMIGPALVLLKVEVNHGVGGIFILMGELN